MMKKMCVSFVLLGALLFVSCQVDVYTPTPAAPTQIEIQNDLNNLDVTVGNILYSNATIDLYNITVGDVFYSSVLGGNTSSVKTTNRQGSVTVQIGEIDMISGNKTLIVKNLDAMKVTLIDGVINTIVFDSKSSNTIFSALGKKKVQ